MAVANTLTYNETATVTTVKSFVLLASGVNGKNLSILALVSLPKIG
jgi:hypothetical protein